MNLRMLHGYKMTMPHILVSFYAVMLNCDNLKHACMQYIYIPIGIAIYRCIDTSLQLPYMQLNAFHHM